MHYGPLKNYIEEIEEEYYVMNTRLFRISKWTPKSKHFKIRY